MHAAASSTSTTAVLTVQQPALVTLQLSQDCPRRVPIAYTGPALLMRCSRFARSYLQYELIICSLLASSYLLYEYLMKALS